MIIINSYTSGQSAANEEEMMGYNHKKDYQLKNKKFITKVDLAVINFS
jgi:hypothetical protein